MPVPEPDEEALFQAARRIDSPEGRRAFLQQACGENTALRARIEALLQVHQEDRSFLEAPALGLTVPLDETGVSEGPGAVIGPYKLLEQIGEGSFGIVFEAEQTEPVRRKVALKVLKPGMDTRQVVARFRAEQQALAMMDHANIARVLDGGATASGRPYFVMELIRGIPITDFCDQNHLSVRERLELFVSVCRAVQHAHQKCIIHRDIKPTNVLVTRQEGKAVVKVIDFGIAKALGQQLTEKTQLTVMGALVGTLEYMSPEQAELGQLDIDTRSDVYALGVLLYRLLTGTTPLEKKRLEQTALSEVLRIIREEEPPRPSAWLSATDQLPSIAGRAGLEPTAYLRMLRGDLDWIVLKAMKKDRSQRYSSASALANDVECYLNGQPVPQRGYTLFELMHYLLRHRHPIEGEASWGTISLLSGVIVLLTHVTLYALIVTGQRLAWLGLTAAVHWGLIALVFWRQLGRRWRGMSAIERHALAGWSGHAIAWLLLFCLAVPGGPLAGPAALAWYPPLSVATGLTYFAQGSVYWGRFYLFGLGFFALAALMQLHLAWAPLEFAVAHGGGLIALGLYLRRRARRLSNPLA